MTYCESEETFKTMQNCWNDSGITTLQKMTLVMSWPRMDQLLGQI